MLVIWEFEMLKATFVLVWGCDLFSLMWKEITTIPSSLCEDVNTDLYKIDKSMHYPFISCIGVGYCTWFILDGCIRVMEVVSYTVSEKTWSRLPNYPLDKEGYVRVICLLNLGLTWRSVEASYARLVLSLCMLTCIFLCFWLSVIFFWLSLWFLFKKVE